MISESECKEPTFPDDVTGKCEKDDRGKMRCTLECKKAGQGVLLKYDAIYCGISGIWNLQNPFVKLPMPCCGSELLFSK